MKSTTSAGHSRNLFLDVIKAFAIILVVVGHCIQYGAGKAFLQEKLFFDDIIFKVIYSFHMPLFMLISGYLFAYGRSKSTKEVFVGKFKSLIVPILCWNLLPMIWFGSKKWGQEGFGLLDFATYCIDYNLYSFWFLWAVFVCSCVIALVSRLFKDNVLVYAALFIVTFITPDAYNFHLYKYMYPFFVAGYLYKKHDLQAKLKPLYEQKWAPLALGVLYIGLFLFFNRQTHIYTSGYTLLGKDWTAQLGIDLYRFAIGFVGSAFAIVSLHRLYKITKVREWIAQSKVVLTIGQNTLGIYIISTFVNTLILMVVTKNLASINYGLIAIEAVGVTALSLLITKAIQHSKFLNRYLLGQYKRVG